VKENTPTLRSHILVYLALLDDKILTIPTIQNNTIHCWTVKIVPATRTILTRVKIVFFAQLIHWTVLFNVAINVMLVNLKQQRSIIPSLPLNAQNVLSVFIPIDKMYQNVQRAPKVIIRMNPLHPIVLTVLKASMAMEQMLSHL